MKKAIGENIFRQISALVDAARGRVAASINQEMAMLYWNVGKIVKEEILENSRADYGKGAVLSLSGKLTAAYGQGFSAPNLWNMVKFYESYPILYAVRRELSRLSWTHIRTLIYLEDKLKRQFYALLCVKEQWSTRVLNERIDSMLYERTALSRLPEKTIKNQLKQLKIRDTMTPELTFRDPYVLDFLRLRDTYGEKDLENAIISALGRFILEFGRDFCFVARQKRITVGNDDFYLDLLFYHRKLKCFVAIDLKLGKFKPEYKGQMELYLRYLERFEMSGGENPPVGIILCAEKDAAQVELLCLPHDRIRVARYLTRLPSKKMFKEELRRAVRMSGVKALPIDF